MSRIEADFYFEQSHNYLIEVYDSDDAGNLDNLKNHDFIGSATFTLHKVVSSRMQTYEATLTGSKKKHDASIKITGEEKKQNHGSTTVQMSISAKITDFTGNCFLVINKSTNIPGNFKPIYKSEAKNHKDSAGKNLIHWNTVFTDTDTLADSEISNAVLIQVFKFSTKGNHQRAASFELTFGDIKNNKKFETSTSDGKH